MYAFKVYFLCFHSVNICLKNDICKFLSTFLHQFLHADWYMYFQLHQKLLYIYFFIIERMSYEQIMAQLGNLMKSGSKTNAFAPLIWLCSIVIFTGMIGIYYFNEAIIKYSFIVLIFLVIIFALIMYVVLLIKDPRLLQSENYRIEDKKLDIIASKGEEIQFNPVDLTTPTRILENK